MSEIKRWLLLNSGAHYTYGELTCEGMDFTRDVVGALSRISRGGGQYHIDWSVAAHAACSALVARDAGWDKPRQRHCLHHDDAEALVGDCVSPLKQLLRPFAGYEDAAEEAIKECRRRVGPRPIDSLDEAARAQCKQVDLAMLVAEGELLRSGATFPHIETDAALVALAKRAIQRAILAGNGWGNGAKRLYLNVMEDVHHD